MQYTNFNLIQVVQVLKQKWKQIFAFVLICLALALGVLFIIPKQYRSVVVAVAANPALADKARLFNNNIQGLYSNFGNGDDLDRIYGIANLDTTFKQLVNEFNLTEYYELKDADKNLQVKKAILQLREDIELEKTELSQLKIMVYTKNKQLSSNIANKMIEIVQQMTEDIWKKNYQTSLNKINQQAKILQDSVTNIHAHLKQIEITQQGAIVYTNKIEVLNQQLKQYYTLANEINLTINNNAPSLYILENAFPSAKHDKPKKINVLIATLILSFLFASIVALLYNNKTSN